MRNQRRKGTTAALIPCRCRRRPPIWTITRSNAGVSSCSNDSTSIPVSAAHAARGAVLDRQPDCCRDASCRISVRLQTTFISSQPCPDVCRNYPMPVQDAGVALDTHRVQRAVPRHCSIWQRWRPPAGVCSWIEGPPYAYIASVAGPPLGSFRELTVPRLCVLAVWVRRRVSWRVYKVAGARPYPQTGARAAQGAAAVLLHRSHMRSTPCSALCI